LERFDWILDVSESYLEQIRISYLPYKTPQEGMIALKKGDIDALVYDAPILRYYIYRDYPGAMQVLPKRLLRQNYGIALTSKSPLREQINVILLQKIREKAWYNQIIEYLGE
jgi:ABC-type amino acid transport substrate-binding protein